MSGTPLDLTPFGPVVSAIGWLYWLTALLIVGIAWWLPKLLWQKAAAASIAVAAVYLVFVRPVQMHVQAQQQEQQASKAKLDDAVALFKKRCEGAGEKIARTVENVDGVVWLKWRPKEVNLSDQFRLNDPYGHDCYADECIKRLLRVTKGAEFDPTEAKEHAIGYRFVETVDPADGKRYRYTAAIAVTHQRTPEQLEQYKRNTGRDPGLDVYGFALSREPVATFSTRYGITWDDLSTHQDREHWIAGSSLKVIDLQANEVIAERVGYNSWGIALHDAGEAAHVFNGDQRALLRGIEIEQGVVLPADASYKTYKWSATNWAANGTLNGGKPEADLGWAANDQQIRSAA